MVSAPLCAWGDKGHRTVSALALRSLPAEPRRWFTGQESVVADHASDPDHWKQDRKEGPRHFLNVEPYGGQEQVPHALEDAQAKLRGDFYRRGVLPWIIQDRWRDLVDAFKTGDAARIAMATAILGHYIADAHVPLHTTENFDGQATDQKGVHSRWETGLVERYLQPDELTVLPAKSDAAFLDQPWTWLQTSHSRVSQLLQDDQVADRTTPTDDGRKRRTQAYWTMFWAKQGPVVTQQLQDAGQHLGDAILNAWIAAGKPPAIVNPSH